MESLLEVLVEIDQVVKKRPMAEAGLMEQKN
jgi:hypothetical protein